MKFKIPKTLEIGSRTITVKTVKRCSNCDDSVDGQAIYAKGIIELKESIFSNMEYALFVFCHEWAHHMFNRSGYDNLAKNEALVDRMADALLQSIKTME